MLKLIAVLLLLVLVVALLVYFVSPEFREMLKGFRGIALVWAMPALGFVESVLGMIGNTIANSGQPIVSFQDLKFAIFLSAITTLKLWITDAVPRLRGEMPK